jgi:hypothetical protein
LAIATGAFLEIARVRRGDSLLAPWHFRLRLISAAIWFIILLSLAGAVTMLWPAPNATYNQKLQFVSVINGVALLIALALLLLGGDFWSLMRARRRIEQTQARRFSEELRHLADVESARLQAEQRAQQNGAAVDSSSNSSHE